MRHMNHVRGVRRHRATAVDLPKELPALIIRQLHLGDEGRGLLLHMIWLAGFLVFFSSDVHDVCDAVCMLFVCVVSPTPMRPRTPRNCSMLMTPVHVYVRACVCAYV